MLPCSRRELLAAFLGIVTAGCHRRAPALPPGEIVGANVALGHRLRERHTLKPAVWHTVPLVIVGAGVAGLSAAWHLRRNKFDRYVVLELEPAPGGTARAGSGGVVPYPWGAHYLPAPMKDNAPLLSLLREMDVVEGQSDDGEPVYAEHVLCRDPHERLFARGEWHEGLWLAEGASDQDRDERRRFFAEVDRWVAWRDGDKRAFTLPGRAASDHPDVLDLDRLSMGDWMRERGFTSPRLWWQVDYACRDDYGARPDDVSAWAGLFYFASRRKAPGAESQPMLTWPEGNGRLVAHLAKSAPIKLGVAVAELIPRDRGVDVVGIEASGRIVGWHAERVIFAGPHFVARHVLRDWRERPPAHLGRFTYGSWMVANLHLKGRPREEGVPLSWDNVLYDSGSLGYVVATHQKGLDHGPTIFTYYYPLCDTDANAGRRKLYQLGRDEWAELALADLERAHPDLRSLTERVDVMRWGHAMIRPGVGFRRGAERRAAAQPYRGVHFAHSDLSGLPLFEEAFDQGARAAAEVRAALA